MLGDELEECGDFIGFPDVVLVGDCDVVAIGFLDQAEKVFGNAKVLLVLVELNTRVFFCVFLKDFPGVVLAAVVLDEDFELGVGLLE